MLSFEEQNFLEKQFLDLFIQGQIAFCDPPTGLSVITDRISFQNAFEKLFSLAEFKQSIQKICETKMFEKQISVNVPKTLLIQETQLSSEIIIERKNKVGLKFPLICKTQVATATDNSHLLAIVLNDQGLKELSEHQIYRNETYLIQELINHNAKIFKVYAIQDEIVLDKRKSLPNLTFDLVKQNSFVFNSQQSFASQLEFLANVNNIDEIYKNAPEGDMDILQTISKFIHQEISLGMYGFDIVIEDQTNDYYLVDINYYPGYKNQQGIETKFHQYFLNQIKSFEKKK